VVSPEDDIDDILTGIGFVDPVGKSGAGPYGWGSVAVRKKLITEPEVANVFPTAKPVVVVVLMRIGREKVMRIESLGFAGSATETMRGTIA
jgi:hypothetical protein